MCRVKLHGPYLDFIQDNTYNRMGLCAIDFPILCVAGEWQSRQRFSPSISEFEVQYLSWVRGVTREDLRLLINAAHFKIYLNYSRCTGNKFREIKA